MIQLQYENKILEEKMVFRGSYDSRFYSVSKIFAIFIVIIAFGFSYNNRIKLSESIMITVICILLLFIQKYRNKIKEHIPYYMEIKITKCYISTNKSN